MTWEELECDECGLGIQRVLLVDENDRVNPGWRCGCEVVALHDTTWTDPHPQRPIEDSLPGKWIEWDAGITPAEISTGTIEKDALAEPNERPDWVGGPGGDDE